MVEKYRTGMRITAIETIHLSKGIQVHAGPIQWLWVRIHTDEGLIGLGETYPHPEAEKAVIHHSLAPILLGRDPLSIDRLWSEMFQAISYSGWAGAEMRAISAVDIALWDLAGKAAGVPIYQLLGGASRKSIRTYNTCYDHIDFLTEPVRLARELLDSGIRAMKIWPFDGIAHETGGQYITPDQMRRGLEPIRLIREEYGDSIEIATTGSAGTGVSPLRSGSHKAGEPSPCAGEMLLRITLPLTVPRRRGFVLAERLMTRYGFGELFENRAVLESSCRDICWCEDLVPKKIASMAETYYLPGKRPITAENTCTSPAAHLLH